MIATLITLFIILAIASLLWWGLSQLPLPPVVKVVVQVLVGLILLIFIWHSFSGNTGSLSLK